MSNKATAACLEGIHGISFRVRPHECLEAAVIRYVHAIREKVREIMGDADLEHADRCVRRHHYENIYVARGFGLIARDRAKQRGVQYAAPPKFSFVSAKSCYHLFAVHLLLNIRP